MSIYFDDQQLCLPHGIIVKSIKAQDATYVGVVPNPARDRATLVLTEELSTPSVFVVFNTIGAEVMRYNLPAETVRFEFSTSGLSPALYHYQVRGPLNLIGEGKLAISR
ncbi:MAG: hypothetical protein KF843_15310 [Flavobacteriales bacterium]|nr:hypothetical protein [Flavobacteriales bacterium]